MLLMVLEYFLGMILIEMAIIIEILVILQGRTNEKSFLDYLLHGIFVTFYGLVKYLPPPIGDWLRYLFVKPFIKKIGFSKIGEGVTLWYPYRIKIGNNTTLNEWVLVNGCGGVEIGNGVRIGHRTSITSFDHKFDSKKTPIYKQGTVSKKTSICDDVYIGANVNILKGVKIGKGAVIGAGSVVTKDVQEYSIMAGVPAKQIGKR